MIVRPKHNWFSLLFVWKGSVLQSIIPQLIFMAAISILAVLTHGRVFGEKIPLNTAPFTLFGLTLAIFLAFRNNASYERFKEARQLWGNALNATRALTSQILCYMPQVDQAHRLQLVNMLIAYVYALKHQLRGTDPTQDFVRLLGVAEAEVLQYKTYKPIVILNDIRERLVHLQSGAEGVDTTRWMMERQLDELGQTVGGCERIVSTPIPFSYSVLLHRTVYAYCILLPFGLVDSTELFTPLICVFFAYTLVALEAIASEVAEPFSLAPNSLALDAMARMIERTLLELCGRDLPEDTPVVEGAYQVT